ncbi:hypothetical protein ABZ942_27920 [Nocardia sp. NPDC046473]|uniref:hypothetical protein n=1 Tax=Nocardia sp. NPDC046473 TaxID=3155733 RepID=UPI0033E67C14
MVVMNPISVPIGNALIREGLSSNASDTGAPRTLNIPRVRFSVAITKRVIDTSDRQRCVPKNASATVFPIAVFWVSNTHLPSALSTS